MWTKEINQKFIQLVVQEWVKAPNEMQVNLLRKAQQALIDQQLILTDEGVTWRGMSDIRGNLLTEFRIMYPQVYAQMRSGKRNGRPLSANFVAELEKLNNSQEEVIVSTDNIVLCNPQTSDQVPSAISLTQYGSRQQISSQLHKLTPRALFSVPSQTVPVVNIKGVKQAPKMTEVSRVIQEEHAVTPPADSVELSRLHGRISELEDLVMHQDETIKVLVSRVEALSADLTNYLENATAGTSVDLYTDTSATTDVLPVTSGDNAGYVPFVKQDEQQNSASFGDGQQVGKKPKAVVACLFKPEQEQARRLLEDKYDLILLEPDTSPKRITEHASTADVVFMMIRYISHMHENMVRIGIDKAKSKGHTVRMCRITGSMSALNNQAKQELQALTSQ